MKNIPKRIFLNVGDLEDSNIDFAELRDVTWSDDRIYDTDIEYILKTVNVASPGMIINFNKSPF